MAKSKKNNDAAPDVVDAIVEVAVEVTPEIENENYTAGFGSRDFGKKREEIISEIAPVEETPAEDIAPE